MPGNSPQTASNRVITDLTSTVTVANSGTTSGSSGDLKGKTLCGVFIPASLTGTNLTFHISSDNITFVPLHDGTAAVLHVVASSTYLKLNPADFAGVQFLKIVVDTQTGAKVFTLALRPV